MTGILACAALVADAVGPARAADPQAAGSYVFVLCDTNPAGLAADPDAGTCYADHADFWESRDDCLSDRQHFIWEFEDRFGPMTAAAAKAGYRCISKADWHAAVRPDERAPVSKLPAVN